MNLDEKKQDFNDGYIKASQEAYDLLIEAGYPDASIVDLPFHKNYLLVTFDGFIISQNIGIDLKQFYINNKVLSWDEPKAYISDGTLQEELERDMKDGENKTEEPIHISDINDLDNLSLSSDSEEITGDEMLSDGVEAINITPMELKELTLKEILQDVQDRKMSVAASELLIKARFKINEGKES